MKNQSIKLSIAFGDTFLDVIPCDDGHDRVTLKPICDVIGVNWQTTTRKIKEGTYLFRRLGVNLTPLKGGQKPHICIRLDRVTSFLNTLNPEKVRSMGNVDTADWLEAKHAEWDDALHNYETYGSAVKKITNTDRLLNHLVKYDKLTTTSTREVYAEALNNEFGLDLPVSEKLPLVPS